MQAQGSWPPGHEPFRRTLTRNFAIALGVGVALALAQRQPQRIAANALLALWFSLGGHYVELLFLNRIRSRIARAWVLQRLARFAVWFGGGVVLYLLMSVSGSLLELRAPVARLWWVGGLAFIGVELIVHVTLAWRGLPNFYRGDG